VTLRRSPSKEEIIALLPGKEFLITERNGEIDADIIRAGKDLRLIQRLGAQTYDIDLEAARTAGIPVCTLPVVGCIRVAEHMLLQMLACAKRLRESIDVTLSAEDFGQPPRRCDENYFAYNWTGRRTSAGCGAPPWVSWATARSARSWPAGWPVSAASALQQAQPAARGG